jgi:hypothetical protein
MSQQFNTQSQEPSVLSQPIEQAQPTNPATPPTTIDQPKRKRRRRRSSSPKAAAASRRNGAKSNGPTTPEGRTRRNRANLIHGAYSHSDLILPEDQDRYDTIFNDFLQRLRPSDHYELEFVEQMMSASWRRRRHSAVLHQLYNEAVTVAASLPANQGLSSVALAAKAYKILRADPAAINALEAAEYREGRKFHTAVRSFRDHEKHREKSNLSIDPGNA